MKRRTRNRARRGPVMLAGETLTENDVSTTVSNLLDIAEKAGPLGADDVKRLALERARRLLRLGGIEAPDAQTPDGNVVPMAKKSGEGA